MKRKMKWETEIAKIELAIANAEESRRILFAALHLLDESIARLREKLGLESED